MSRVSVINFQSTCNYFLHSNDLVLSLHTQKTHDECENVRTASEINQRQLTFTHEIGNASLDRGTPHDDTQNFLDDHLKV